MSKQSPASNQSATVLVPVTSAPHGQRGAKLGPPLTRQQIIHAVSLLDPNQATHMGPLFAYAQRVSASMFGQYQVVVAVWPDHVAAVLAFEPRLTKPRAEQLIRAYNTARAGACLTMEPSDTEDEDLPCPPRI